VLFEVLVTQRHLGGFFFSEEQCRHGSEGKARINGRTESPGSFYLPDKLSTREDRAEMIVSRKVSGQILISAINVALSGLDSSLV
jgi:hypothetical protein